MDPVSRLIHDLSNNIYKIKQEQTYEQYEINLLNTKLTIGRVKYLELNKKEFLKITSLILKILKLVKPNNVKIIITKQLFETILKYKSLLSHDDMSIFCNSCKLKLRELSNYGYFTDYAADYYKKIFCNENKKPEIFKVLRSRIVYKKQR